MGYKQSPALIVVALLFATVTPPLAYGVPTVDSFNFTGEICCTSNRNCAPGSVRIPGARVNLNCSTLSGGVETLGQDITDSTGEFILPLNGAVNLEGGPFFPGAVPPCLVFVDLPLNSTVCPILDTATGTLVGINAVVGTVFDNVLGLVTRIRVQSFINATIG